MRVKVDQRNCTVKRTTVVSGRHGITMRVKVGQRNCTVKRTTVVPRRHCLTTRVKVGQGNCTVKRTTVVPRRHRLIMKVKVGQRNSMFKRTRVASRRHHLSTRMKFGKQNCMLRGLQLCQISIVSAQGQNLALELYGLENYSYVKSELSHQTNENWPKILYCTVKKTTVVLNRVLFPRMRVG